MPHLTHTGSERGFNYKRQSDGASRTMDKLSENSSGVEERLTGRLPKGFGHLRQHAIPSMGWQVHFEDLTDPRTRNSSDFYRHQCGPSQKVLLSGRIGIFTMCNGIQLCSVFEGNLNW